MRYAITRFANTHDIVAATLLLAAFSTAAFLGYHLFTAPAGFSRAGVAEQQRHDGVVEGGAEGAQKEALKNKADG